MIDLAALEKALAPIEELGKQEFPLTIAGVDLVLRPLEPDVEREVQGWAREALQDEKGLEKEENSHIEVLEYLDRFKLGVLSNAVIQIGSLVLRDVKYVAVGRDENDQIIQRSRTLVVRDLLERKFSRPVLLSLFKAYGDLMARVELDTEKSVVYDMVDLETEIARVKERLEELEQLKAAQQKPSADALSNQIKSAVKHTEHVQDTNRQVAGAAAQERRTDRPVLEPKPERRAERRAEPAPPPRSEVRPEPQSGVPEAVRQARARSGDSRQSAVPTSVPAPVRRAESEPEPPPPEVMDSFSEADGDALARENQRLLQQRKKHRIETDTAVTPARPARRLPPHRQAANTEDAVLDAGGAQLRRAQPVGTIEGKEAYRLPTTDLTPRRGNETPKINMTEAAINDEGGGGQRNPVFKPRR